MILLGPFMRSLVIPREAEKKEETYPTMNKVPLPSYMCKVWLLRCRQLSTPKLFWGGDNGRLYMSTVYTQQFFGWVLTTFLLNKSCLEKILFSKNFALASLALGDCSTPEHFLGVDSVCTCQILGWG